MNERFIRTETLIGQQNLRELKEATVMVVGLGGVGGYAAEALVRSGVGTLIVIDHDAVEYSNFNRQILADEESLGQKKTDVFRRRAAKINPEAEVICYDCFLTADNLESFFVRKPDYVVDAIDTLTSKVALWKYCQENEIEIISCLGTAKKLDLTKLKITTLEKTENDPMAKALRQIARKNGLSLKVPVVFSGEQPLNRSSEVLGSMMFVPAGAGILCAQWVVSGIIDKQSN
ncbi:MAG: tRNA threonylcarbamoyladenosine dehydratase [Erysipelotrichaceae bacterium]|nr:tRNA threonylcarbamoyladenosine dehydratase [Erysipelotrichaceae bacterium]